MRILGLGLAAMLLASAAQAAPVFLPVRDVRVTYALLAPGQPVANYQLSYDAADELARIDSQAGFFVLANLPQGQAQLVLPQLHATVQAPDFSTMTQLLFHADGARFTPLGPGRYIGLACEKYLVMNAQGSGEACLTPGGVVLHFAGSDPHGSAEATALSVDFSPLPAAEFALPQGYSPITLPPGALAALLQAQ